jgi:hypothetical protein
VHAWRTLLVTNSRLNVVVSCAAVAVRSAPLLVQRSERSDEDGDPETPVDNGADGIEGNVDSPVSEEPPTDDNDGFREGDIVERETKGPRQCRFCPFITQFPSALTRHERIHTGEKPFKCRYCTFRSAQRCHAVRHEAQHTSRKAGRRRAKNGAAKAMAARAERKLAEAANALGAQRDFSEGIVKTEGVASGAVVGSSDMPTPVGPNPALYAPTTRFPAVYGPSGYPYVDSREAQWGGHGFAEANQLRQRALPYPDSYTPRFGYAGARPEPPPYYFTQPTPYSSQYGAPVPTAPLYPPPYPPASYHPHLAYRDAVEPAPPCVLRCTEGWTAILQPTAFRMRSAMPRYDPVAAFGYPSTAPEKRWQPYPHFPPRTPPSSYGVPPYGSSWTPTAPSATAPPG